MRPILCKFVSGDAKGIFQSIKQGMNYLDMEDNWAQKLVGCNTNGSAINP